MLLFSRVVTFTGSPRRWMSWANEVTAYANEHSDLGVALWSADFGYPLGTVAWSCATESQVALAAETAKLLADDGYFDLLEQAEDLITQPGEDLLRELVHGERNEPPPVGSVATITTATAVADRTIDAVGWAVDVAQHVTNVTGNPVSVWTNVYGQFGQITWIGVVPDLAGLEASRVAINSDADYLAKLAGTKDVFLPGSGHFAQVSRIV